MAGIRTRAALGGAILVAAGIAAALVADDGGPSTVPLPEEVPKNAPAPDSPAAAIPTAPQAPSPASASVEVPTAPEPSPAAPESADSAEAPSRSRDALESAWKEYRVAGDEETMLRCVAILAACGDAERFARLLEIVEGTAPEPVREAAALALTHPDAEPLAPRIAERARAERSRIVAVALRLALQGIRARSLQDAGAFEIRAEFESIGTSVVRTTARVTPAASSSSLRVQVSLVGAGERVSPSDRTVGPAAAGEVRETVVDHRLAASGKHSIVVTASGRDGSGPFRATSRRWSVRFVEERLLVAEEDMGFGESPASMRHRR